MILLLAIDEQVRVLAPALQHYGLF